MTSETVGIANALVRADTWLVGGDGWAYDIGFGGLDHVLAMIAVGRRSRLSSFTAAAMPAS